MPTTYVAGPTEDTPPAAVRTITYRSHEIGGADIPIDVAPITAVGPIVG